MANLANIKEVCELLRVSQGMGYKVIRDLNSELKKKGYITIQGRVPLDYLKERFNLKNDSNEKNPTL